KEPTRRYASAQALADDLESWQAGEPIAARRAGRAERAFKWARRRPALAALVAVSFTAFIALIVLGVVSWRNAEKRAQAVKDLTDAQRQIEQKRAEIDSLSQAAVAQRLAMHREQLETRRKFYLSDLRLAFRSWQNDEPAAAIRLLAPYAPG